MTNTLILHVIWIIMIVTWVRICDKMWCSGWFFMLTLTKNYRLWQYFFHVFSAYRPYRNMGLLSYLCFCGGYVLTGHFFTFGFWGLQAVYHLKSLYLYENHGENSCLHTLFRLHWEEIAQYDHCIGDSSVILLC